MSKQRRLFASFLPGRAKYQHGMTGFDKLISESVPNSELHKGLTDARVAGQREALEHARKMADQLRQFSGTEQWCMDAL